MIWPRIWWGVVAAGALIVSEAPTLGTDALILPNGPITDVAAVLDGGAGWSFVPTTNLLVTAVGYLNFTAVGGDPDAVVAIWAGTNTILSSYADLTNASAPWGEIITVAVPPLPLSAGQPYTITVYKAPLAGSWWHGSLHDNSGLVVDAPFQVASELSQFQAWQLNQNSTFTPFPDPGLNQLMLWLGPTFTYEIGLPRPTLRIARPDTSSITLTWPTNQVGYVLQSSVLVQGVYSNVTNSPAVSGVSYSLTLPATNAAAFFRLSKQG